MSSLQRQFYERVLKLIRRYHMIEAGDGIIVAVSGGIDSVVLLYVLHHLRERLDIHLYSAHLNHQFRGQEAERDAEFVRRFSAQLEVPCFVTSQNVPELAKQERLSPQDAARQVRYQFLTSLAEQVQAQKIATAHQADDQAETFLIGLLRGVGVHGLGGIQPVLHGKIIRPFLTTTRAQIESFAQVEGLEYVQDSSNASRKYLRNAVRLDLLPLLKQQFNPAIVKRLTAYAQLFQEDAFFIDKIAAERYIQLCEHAEDGVKIHLERFAKEDRTLQRALIYTMFQELTGARQVLETDHARAVIDLFTHGETGARLSLPSGVLAIRSYTHGYLQRKPEPGRCASALPVIITVPGTSTFDMFSVETDVLATIPPEWQSIRGSNTAQLITQCMDYDRISPPITVRYRLPGDQFCPLGMKGKKTLKKFFIDRKILRDTRDKIPLFEDQQGIFWVTGYGVDDRVKITENTKKVLRCRVYKQVQSAK